MIQTISIKDARNNLADIVSKVEMAGDEIIITKFGKPRVKIIPLLKDTSSKIDLSESFGAWSNRRDIKNTAKWVSEMRDKTSLRK